jgi:hypothetical protein
MKPCNICHKEIPFLDGYSDKGKSYCSNSFRVGGLLF